ncbi:bifunctional glutamate N-acetyltransferase/amino-acid acetyltransferase ArgJ [Pelagibacteraceae bacterium]|nr:bifunctional glutamate N-acetyltransferase/amino-acid acetyltransferase ArgJ [Pelagibacteraceae bacterium]
MKNSSTKDLSSNERLSIKNRSFFTPKKYINLIPDGLKIYTFHAGFKKKLDDLLVVVFDKTINTSIVYSKTSMPSAPIIWDKNFNKGKVKVLVVNSGNANAHTGREGIRIINEYTDFISKNMGCKKNEILVSSTGIIGEIFNPVKIIKQILKIKNKSSNSLLDGAKAIMTTDTYPKVSSKTVVINNTSFKIYGICKGSGMINPKMGTMLAYIFIEAKLSKKILNKLLRDNLEDTFNSISIDSDTSTSDTLALFSLDKERVDFSFNKNYKILNSSLFEVMKDLSLQVVKDGEGLSKLIKVNILKSKSKQQAKNIGFSIINSPLVKTAISGEDANWGRIIAAIGKSYENINQNKVKVLFGKNLVCEKGSINKYIGLKSLNKYMKNKIIEITVILNSGSINHTVYGNDLTHEYIRINADYRN